MGAAIPLRQPDPFQDAERAAEEALARFRAQWPVERTRDLAAAVYGDEAAGLRIAARSIANREAETPADAAVRSLIAPLVGEA